MGRESNGRISDGVTRLAQAIEAARQIMHAALWVKTSPDPEQEKAAADRQLKNQLAVALDHGFVLHDPLHPEFRLGDQHNQFGLFNPDNRYQIATIATPGTYVIRGRRGTSADLQVQVGTTGDDGVSLEPISGLSLSDLVVVDGSFEIVISDTPSGDNWLSNSKGDLKATTILVRESFMDWEKERSGTWSIDRADSRGTPSPLTDPDLVNAQYARAADHLEALTEGWIKFVSTLLVLPELAPRNDLSVPKPAERGLQGQWNSSGIFPNKPGRATVVTLVRSKSRYQSFQLGDLWFNSFDYCRRQTSLTMEQARKSSDGLYRFVISADDPGVLNWLDPSGAATVFAFLRWQGVERDYDPSRDIRSVKVVDFDKIRDEFPDDEPRVTPEERRAQLAARQASSLTSSRGY